MARDTPDGVKGRYTVVGGPRDKPRERFTVRVEVREPSPDDLWLQQAARRRRLVLGIVAVTVVIAFLFMWVL
jgi:type II secretory pathway component PulM